MNSSPLFQSPPEAMHGFRPYIETPAYLSEADLTAILRASDWKQLRDRTLRTLHIFGVDGFMSKIDLTLPNGCVHTRSCGTLPDTLMERFADMRFAESDPIARHVTESGLPSDWEINDLCESEWAGAYLQLRMCGVKRGISMAVRTERAVTRIDFYRKSGDAFPRSAALRANLLLLASYLHAAGKALCAKDAAAQVEPLTERELECLRFSAAGKTGREIGMILGISQRTVYFHMKNIAKKFNVYSTRQVISRAVGVGLIKLGG